MSEAAAEVLGRVFGYSSFRGQQQEIIEHVCAGGDAVALMPTGSGKSLCYQIPALVREGARSCRTRSTRSTCSACAPGS